MSMDSVLAIFIALCGIGGFFSGALAQVARLVAAFIAYFLAFAMAPALTDWLVESLGVSFSFLPLVTGGCFGLIVYGLLSSGLVFVLTLDKEHAEDPALVDRTVGILVGLLKGVLVLAVFSSGLLLVRDLPPLTYPEAKVWLDDSDWLRAYGQSGIDAWLVPDELRSWVTEFKAELPQPAVPLKLDPSSTKAH